MKIPIANDFSEWVMSINNEVMANFISKLAALKIRSKLNYKDGKTVILNFMKHFIQEIIKDKGGLVEPFLSQVNPLIAYTLGMLKHSMFADEYDKGTYFYIAKNHS